LIEDLGGLHADRGAAQAVDEVADRGGGEADAHPLHVVDRADRLLRGVHVPRLVREEHQHLHALVLGVEVLRAQLRVVQHLGADLGAADRVGQVDELGHREASRRAAVQEPRHLGLAGTREIVVRRGRRHLRVGEVLERQPPVRRLLELLAPLHQPLGHEVLGADELGDLDFELVLRLRGGGKRARRGERYQCPHRHPPRGGL
jgi:hypothetical protein